MKYVYIGKIVNTHALKGEVRILSNFDFKDKVFKKDIVFYVGEGKDSLKVESYRKHKQFDMVKFYGIDDINEVIRYKGCKVYVDEDILNLKDDEILSSDLVNYEIYNEEEYVGKISEYRCDNGNKLIKVNDKYIPYNSNFITKYDKINKKIYFHDIGVFL